jgi:hypothetical protein
MHAPIDRSVLARAGLALAVAMAASCSTPARPAASVPRSPAAASAAASDRPSPSFPASAMTAGPPAAALAAEGGDPIEGQLGTYIWGEGGSDSPWLPGARISVGSGEPLTVSFRPATTPARWSARSVPSTADGPAGAAALGEGAGQPTFPAPGPGTWTVEVHVVFAGATGNASYFWQLAVD